jgi:hypothetical protein
MKWKIQHFEFWNTHLFHLPVYLYWLYLSCKARSLFFFSAANPGIETGGLMGESKYRILQKIKPKYLPRTLIFTPPVTAEEVLSTLDKNDIQFPFIVKPDVGQGGWMIDLIKDHSSLENFLMNIQMPFIVQEYITDEIELGILYYRLPNERKGRITSVAVKELLFVEGDGQSSIKTLMEKNPRARKQLERLNKKDDIGLQAIPRKGEKVNVSFAGNHSYGTKFLNGNWLIDDKLHAVFDELCSNIGGFYFGRFDLRCKSFEDLKQGKFKILELNGAGSEPLHIFDPSANLWDAYSTAFNHWRLIYKISLINKKLGVRYMRFKEALTTYRYVRRIQQMHNLDMTIGN